MNPNFGEELLELLNGLGNSLTISGIGIVLAMVIGCVGGALRHAGIPVVSAVLGAYVNFFRCTPLIVQIFFLYSALPQIGIRLSPFEAGWIALALWGGAYQTETFRAGFGSVPPNEILAARALGMGPVRAFLDITLPLGVRTSIPSLTTTAIAQFRSSAFMIAIGYVELTAAATSIANETFDVFKIFGTAALMYLIVCTLISYGSRLAERRLAVPGMAVTR
jgi:His/Glu/Gln/Arg/opine family amino acid ABC transporter permease subunit